MSDNREKMVLIDGNSLINRAYFATPAFSTSKGFPTNAIFGFLNLLWKISDDLNPDYMVVAFDVHAPTFRHKEYAEYKAGRRPMDDALKQQMPVLKELLSVMGIKTCEMEGYEADDIIGTLSSTLPVHSYIYTGDRDSYQLVSEKTDVEFTKRGVSDLLHLTNENFEEVVGLKPLQIIDLKALMGDKSDNIPGVPGIGEKNAMSLLEKYGSLEVLYEHLDEIKGATQKKLLEGKDSAFFSKHLATILLDVPLSISLEECRFPKKYPQALKEKFIELEFKSFLLKNIFEADNTPAVALKAEILKKDVRAEEGLKDLLGKIEKATVVALEDEKDVFLYFDGTQYRLPIRENFFDEGFFVEELTSLYRALFEDEKKTITLFDAKKTLHYLDSRVEKFAAKIDDVSLLRYLCEQNDKNESLEDLLTFKGYAADERAYGLSCLKEEYLLRLKEEGTEKLYTDLELPLLFVLYEMEKEGVSVDEKGLTLLSERYEGELKEICEEIYSLAGETFNINSPAQLGVVLFEKLNLPYFGKKNKKGNYSTNVEVLEKISTRPIVKKILRYREIQKLKSTYLDGLKPLIREGKVHTTYTQTITSTGRLSSVNPNVQNIPVRRTEGKELRKLFTASEGNVLLDADYSQIELRLLAHFSGCKELIEAYRQGEDVHAFTASQVFGVPLNEVTSDLRRKAKAINFGIIYGMSGFGLSQDLEISVSKAQEYISAYFDRYSSVKEYMDSNVAFAKEHGYVTTLLGRKRMIPELKSPNYSVRQFGERAAMNMPLQGSSADIIKIAMIRVQKMLSEKGLKAKLILQVHDELIIDCPIEEKEIVSQILKEGMEGAVSLNVPLTVEVGEGKTWYDAKD